RVQHGILRIIYLYLGLSATCAVAFYWCGLSIWDAVTHMFTTVSTGGFSTRSLSVAAFANPRLEWAFILFMLLGGTSFIPMVRAFRGDWSSLRQSTEVRWYYGMFAVATVLVGYFLLVDPNFSFDFHDILRASAFQVASIL